VYYAAFDAVRAESEADPVLHAPASLTESATATLHSLHEREPWCRALAEDMRSRRYCPAPPPRACGQTGSAPSACGSVHPSIRNWNSSAPCKCREAARASGPRAPSRPLALRSRCCRRVAARRLPRRHCRRRREWRWLQQLRERR
jgi:hypothetical protein